MFGLVNSLPAPAYLFPDIDAHFRRPQFGKNQFSRSLSLGSSWDTHGKAKQGAEKNMKLKGPRFFLLYRFWFREVFEIGVLEFAGGFGLARRGREHVSDRPAFWDLAATSYRTQFRSKSRDPSFHQKGGQPKKNNSDMAAEIVSPGKIDGWEGNASGLPKGPDPSEPRHVCWHFCTELETSDPLGFVGPTEGRWGWIGGGGGKMWKFSK